MEDQNITPNDELDKNLEQVDEAAKLVESEVQEEVSPESEVLSAKDPSTNDTSTEEVVSADSEEKSEAEDISLTDVLEAQDKEEAEAEAPKEVVKAKEPKSNKRWYSLRVISGKEKKIKERIELEIQRNKWSESITQILVPSEKVYKIRNGKKVILERNILPGYILVEALKGGLKGAMITAIANIPNVIHFLGRNHPIPMHQSEANRMLGKVDESQDVSAAMIEPFIVGETIKIIDGPFNDFVGDIKEVNEEKKKLKVIVKIFGRGTEVELNFMQVEKQS